MILSSRSRLSDVLFGVDIKPDTSGVRINPSLLPTSPPLAVQELVEITSVQGWNGFDAEIVDPARWASAAEFCKELKTVTLIRPVLSATGDGSVHVRWKPKTGQEIGAEFDAASRFWWFDADQDGVFEMEFADLAQLIDVAKRHVPAAFERARDAKH